MLIIKQLQSIFTWKAWFYLVFMGTQMLYAQNSQDSNDSSSNEEPKNITSSNIWVAKLPGGTYAVKVYTITSISRHEYLLDNSLIIDEVTIDTNGNTCARFYYISPITEKAPGNISKHVTERASELMQQAGDRMDSNLLNMVVKKYPETTHSRTVEYRLMSKEALEAFYNSAMKAWANGRSSKNFEIN